MFELNKIQQIFLISLIIILVILSTIGYCKYFRKSPFAITSQIQDGSKTTSSSDSLSKENTSSEKITVYICGQVKNPGIYKLPLDCRISEALKFAGGADKLADLNEINLAKRLYDEDMIYVPAVGEKKKYSKTKSKKYNVKKKISDKRLKKKDVNLKSGNLSEEELLELQGVIQSK